jgi:hypothetical protein
LTLLSDSVLVLQVTMAVLSLACTLGAWVRTGGLVPGAGGVVNSGSVWVAVLPSMSVELTETL